MMSPLEVRDRAYPELLEDFGVCDQEGFGRTPMKSPFPVEEDPQRQPDADGEMWREDT